MAELNISPSGGGSKIESATRGLGVTAASAKRPKSGESDHAATSLTPRFVLAALRRWWFLAAPGGVLLAAAAVVAVHLAFQPIYQATAWLSVPDKAPFIAFASQSADNSRRFLDTQIALLRSPLVLGPVLSRPEIAQLPELRNQASPIVWLGNMIKVAGGGQSDLVTISFGASNPAAAARVVNAVLDGYLDLRGRDDAEQTQRVLELLEEERGRRMREVDAMRETIRELAKQLTGKDPFVAKSQNEAKGVHPLADLQAKLVNLQVERQVLEAQLKAFEELTANDDVEVPGARLDWATEEHPSVKNLKAVRMVKKARLDEYDGKLVLGEKDPVYVSLVDDIRHDDERSQETRKEVRDEVRQELAEKMKADRKDELARLQKTLEATRLMEKLLRESNENMLKGVREATGDTLQLEFKQAELARAEQVLAMIAERAIRLRTEQRAPARVTPMRKADELTAIADWRPYYKRQAAAGLAGLCLPLLLVVGWEWLARRVTDARQLELHTRLPVLGEVARMPARAALSRGSLSSRARRELATFEESVDSLRTCLMFSETVYDLRVLSVTSAAAGEGKTSIALQMAISLARASGQPTLLIDADMRSPDMHRLLHVRRGPGLAEVLGRQCSAQEGIVTDWNELVHVMPAGELAASPHRLVGNGAMKALLDELRPLYRYVVIDTPPILSASESLVLARAADVCLVCAMRDVSRIDQVRRGCERLAAAGVRPAGMVLNGLPLREYARVYGTYYGDRGRGGDRPAPLGASTHDGDQVTEGL